MPSSMFDDDVEDDKRDALPLPLATLRVEDWPMQTRRILYLDMSRARRAHLGTLSICQSLS